MEERKEREMEEKGEVQREEQKRECQVKEGWGCGREELRERQEREEGRQKKNVLSTHSLKKPSR